MGFFILLRKVTRFGPWPATAGRGIGVPPSDPGPEAGERTDLFLIYPPWAVLEDRAMLQNCLPPLGLLSVAAQAEASGYRVHVMDVHAEAVDELARARADVRKAGHGLSVGAGQAGGTGQHDPAGCAGADEGSLGAGQLSESLAHPLLQLTQRDERSGGLGHRCRDLRCHERTADVCHRAEGVDERLDA